MATPIDTENKRIEKNRGQWGYFDYNKLFNATADNNRLKMTHRSVYGTEYSHCEKNMVNHRAYW